MGNDGSTCDSVAHASLVLMPTCLDSKCPSAGQTDVPGADHTLAGRDESLGCDRHAEWPPVGHDGDQ